jgi:putative transposase
MDVFLDDEDRARYLAWLWEYAEQYQLELWAYCLMGTHVHHVAVPHREDSLGKTFGLAHMRYSQYFNRKRRQAGHLWQGRFFSCPLDEVHAYRAAGYVERNPVRAGLVARAGDWRWSSARVHLAGQRLQGASWPEDKALRKWSVLLAEADKPSELEAIRKQTYTGRPWGSQRFMAKLEALAGKVLRALPRGRPKAGK